MKRVILLFCLTFSMAVFAAFDDSMTPFWGDENPITSFPDGQYYGGGSYYGNAGIDSYYHSYSIINNNKIHISYYDDDLVMEMEYFFTFTQRGIFNLRVVEHPGHPSLGNIDHSSDLEYLGSGFCSNKQCFYAIDMGNRYIEEIFSFDAINGKIYKSGRKTIAGQPTIWDEHMTLIGFKGVCGDGMLDTRYEQCDDGNNTNGDGCNATCQIEFPSVVSSNRTRIDGGYFSMCYRKTSNSNTKCWGYNNVGQLGLGNTTNVGDGVGPAVSAISALDMGTGKNIALISAGGDHVSESSCALLDDGTIKCWGDNGSGQLGQENDVDLGDGAGEMGNNLPAVALGTGLKAIDLDAGGWHHCALLETNQIKCWGTNIRGELGLGDSFNRGFTPNTMGNNLPYVNLGTGRSAKAIALGGNHTCALLDNDAVKCWGGNWIGQVGNGDVSNVGDAAGEMGDALPYVSLGTGRTVLQLTANAAHTCALLDNGTVKCWGWNSAGNLGQGHTDNIGDAAGEMGDNLAPVSLGTGKTAVQITSGKLHNCALLNDGKVKCWGNNTYGQLGLEDTNNRGDDANEMGDNLPYVNLGTGRTALVIGSAAFSTCALLDNGDLKCWGYNTHGELGLSNTNHIGDQAGEMGDNLPAVSTGL